MVRGRATCLLALSALTADIAVGAEPRDEVTVAVDFRAEAGCAQRADFIDLLRARAPHVREANADWATTKLSVRVKRRSDGAEGRLIIDEPGSSGAKREVTAASCSEVITALALIGAVALEGRSRDEEISVTDDLEQVGEGTMDSVEGWTPIHRPGPDYDPYRAAFGPPSRRGWWSLGFHVGAIAGILPRTAVVPRLFVDARLEGEGMWSPSARLSAARAIYSERHTVSGARVDENILWTAGRADLCPIRVRLTAAGGLWPCGWFEAGFVSQRGTILEGDEEAKPEVWLSTGPLARAQWILFEMLLLELETGAGFPLRRGSASVRVSGERQDVPFLTYYASAGVGGRFP